MGIWNDEKDFTFSPFHGRSCFSSVLKEGQDLDREEPCWIILHRVEMSLKKSNLISYFWNEDLCYRVTDIRLHCNCLFTCLYFLLHCYNKRTKDGYLLIHLPISTGDLGGSVVKNGPVPMQRTQKTQVQSLGQEVPQQEEMATHSSILAWRIARTEEPGGLQSIRSQRVGHDWVSTSTSMSMGYLLHAKVVHVLLIES